MRGFDDTPWRRQSLREDPQVRRNFELMKSLRARGIVPERPHRHGVLVHSPWVKWFRKGASWSRSEEKYMAKLVRDGVKKHHLSQKLVGGRSVWHFVGRKLGRPPGAVYERFALLRSLRRKP